MARQVIVRYKVKADRADENIAYIRHVFAELAESQPHGLRYASFVQDDGVSFVHIALITAESNPLAGVEAFMAFQSEIRDRCEEPPVAVEVDLIGSYRSFDSP